MIGRRLPVSVVLTFDKGDFMPPNRMSRFEIFIGTWNTTGEVLAVDDAPATVLGPDSHGYLSMASRSPIYCA